MGALDNLGFGSGGGVQIGNMAAKFIVLMEWMLIGIVVGGVLFFLVLLLKYKYDVLIIEPRVHGGIRGKREKARKIVKGSIVDYELRSSLFKRKRNRESIAADHSYSIPMGSKDMIVAYKVTEDAFHPVRFINPGNDNKEAQLQVEINKDLIRGIFARYRQTIEKYNEQKWYNHPLFMASVFVIVSFIHLIMFLKLLETAGGVGGVCQSAAEGIKTAVSQQVS